MMKAVNIQWEYDDDEDIDLPDEIELPEYLDDDEEISDYLSDVTGFCHKGFDLVDDIGEDDYDDLEDDCNDSFTCYECGGYGDDYYMGEDGELICRCPECPFNPNPEDWNV